MNHFWFLILDSGEKVYVDVEGKSRLEILEHLQNVLGKPK